MMCDAAELDVDDKMDCHTEGDVSRASIERRDVEVEVG
jgi:hypothetical protein